ncbi:sulfurtransferase complex subunit TusD [Pleionea mediterranea]|uniref:tRNA 2-thiouridine synthesizing protein D n=1 Tax=Pleionea mediterranea TaxID=523701 RepID=A0A316FXF3_9GAMM|nr:sulfurtransferase complex subunit TusD [Pleionea mediterranea]PWK53259.1 tRNA 2-thiouridine synthesizing protein D [Pleionea mediterranea]
MTTRFSILVTGSPFTSQAHHSAQCFVDALYSKGHQVTSVFLYGDGSYVANQLMHPANDESHPHQHWRELAQKHGFKLQACVSAAAKRGILSREDSELSGKSSFNVTSPYEIAGLGAWVEAVANSDKSLHFS